MFCTQCGARRDEKAGFCSECGTRLAPHALIMGTTAAPTGVGRRPGKTSYETWSRAVLLWTIALALVLIVGAATGIVLVRRTNSPSTALGLAPQATQSRPPQVAATLSESPTAAPTNRVRPAATFAAVYERVASGVVRIETTSCDGGGVGSGFLVAENLIATVAHVVSGAVSIAISGGSVTTSGTVIGYDAGDELALIRTDTPIGGKVLRLGSREAAVGTDIGAIGYPLDGGESLSKGAVSGLGRTITVDGHSLYDLIQTDAPINPGNSGGPLLTSDGTVIGLVEAKRIDAENISYAIPASQAAGRLKEWEQSGRQVQWPHSCHAPSGPDGATTDVTDRSGHPDGSMIARAFATYVAGINAGDYKAAYEVLSHAEQHRDSFAEFSSGNVSSFIVELTIDSVTTHGVHDTAEVRFVSVQDAKLGYRGQSCSRWSMTYTFVRSGGAWLIDRAVPHDDGPAAC